MIDTQRLELFPAHAEHLRADLAGRESLSRALSAHVPPSWPPEHYDSQAIEYTLRMLEADGTPPEWCLHYFIRRATSDSQRTLIGLGGYKGAPSADGTVELGYGVLPEFQRQGYGSEATLGMIRRAFEDHRVQRVIAHTLPGLVPSIGVLDKCGFTFIGEGTEEGAICYELKRADYAP